MKARYPQLNFKNAGSFIDPANIAGADTDEKHSLGVLNDAYPELKVGFPF